MQPQNQSTFLQWFHQKGGLVNKINFPSIFPPTNYIGISASEDIAPNQVIMAVPKNLIIGVSTVKQSQIGKLLKECQCLCNEEEEETDFNILVLFLLRQKMLGNHSEFSPYLDTMEKAETIVHWSDEEISQIRDPFITVDYVNQIRKQFPPVYNQFLSLTQRHSDLFPLPLTWQLFMDTYALVMTRVFGWGLPETMLVPFADFFNHNSCGVHHYAFNRQIQQENNIEEYIMKRKQLNLSIFGIENKNELPVSYLPNKREQFVIDNLNVLKSFINENEFDVTRRLDSASTKLYLQTIQKEKLKSSFQVDLYPSTNSQDNDSDEDNSLPENETKQRMFSKQIKKLCKGELQAEFELPKPSVNRQFQDDTTFSWWNEKNPKDSYFIVASDRHYTKGEQIFNSYGRRSNRFLLTWYGFTHQKNKYDSLSFRFWSEQIYEKTGKFIFAKILTEKDWKEDLSLGGERYKLGQVTDQFRMKRDSLCYQLMAYLRLRALRKNSSLKGKKDFVIYRICNLELETLMLSQYLLVLKHLNLIYQPDKNIGNLMSQHHTYFANILIHSDKQILMNHALGIKELIKIVDSLRKGEKLEEAYQKISEEEIEQNQYKQKKFIHGYIRMLFKWLQSQEKKL